VNRTETRSTETADMERLTICRGEIRAKRTDAGKLTLSGYAAKFNTMSEDLGGFRETIAPGTFARSLKDGDQFLLRGHEANAVLARTKSGSLKLEEDAVGLRFEAELVDSPIARDTMALVERGDLDGMSFGFGLVRDDWKWDGPVAIRTLKDVDLFEISVVTWPAYRDTDVGVRSRQAFEAFRGSARGISPEQARLLIAETELRAATA
jgi:uncharacterized protein